MDRFVGPFRAYRAHYTHERLRRYGYLPGARLDALLPWLLLGRGVQVGKLAAKGNGVFELALPNLPGYWQTIFSPVETWHGKRSRWQ